MRFYLCTILLIGSASSAFADELSELKWNLSDFFDMARVEYQRMATNSDENANLFIESRLLGVQEKLSEAYARASGILTVESANLRSCVNRMTNVASKIEDYINAESSFAQTSERDTNRLKILDATSLSDVSIRVDEVRKIYSECHELIEYVRSIAKELRRLRKKPLDLCSAAKRSITFESLMAHTPWKKELLAKVDTSFIRNFPNSGFQINVAYTVDTKSTEYSGEYQAADSANESEQDHQTRQIAPIVAGTTVAYGLAYMEAGKAASVSTLSPSASVVSIVAMAVLIAIDLQKGLENRQRLRSVNRMIENFSKEIDKIFSDIHIQKPEFDRRVGLQCDKMEAEINSSIAQGLSTDLSDVALARCDQFFETFYRVTNWYAGIFQWLTAGQPGRRHMDRIATDSVRRRNLAFAGIVESLSERSELINIRSQIDRANLEFQTTDCTDGVGSLFNIATMVGAQCSTIKKSNAPVFALSGVTNSEAAFLPCRYVGRGRVESIEIKQISGSTEFVVRLSNDSTLSERFPGLALNPSTAAHLRSLECDFNELPTATSPDIQLLSAVYQPIYSYSDSSKWTEHLEDISQRFYRKIDRCRADSLSRPVGDAILSLIEDCKG